MSWSFLKLKPIIWEQVWRCFRFPNLTVCVCCPKSTCRDRIAIFSKSLIRENKAERGQTLSWKERIWDIHKWDRSSDVAFVREVDQWNDYIIMRQIFHLFPKTILDEHKLHIKVGNISKYFSNSWRLFLLNCGTMCGKLVMLKVCTWIQSAFTCAGVSWLLVTSWFGQYSGYVCVSAHRETMTLISVYMRAESILDIYAAFMWFTGTGKLRNIWIRKWFFWAVCVQVIFTSPKAVLIHVNC